jgi:hypothetical protein
MSAEALKKAAAAYPDFIKLVVFQEDGKVIHESESTDVKELK